VRLHSITTMGSPIVFANQMLDVRAEELEVLFQVYRADSPLRWTNIIHPSDVLAYPIRNSIADLCQDRVAWEDCLELHDRYMLQTEDLFGKAVQAIGQPNFEALWKTKDAHTSYFKGREQSSDTLPIIIKTLLGESMQEKAIALLQKCHKITEDYNSDNIKSSEIWAVFKDGSGSLQVFVNALKVDHVYILNHCGTVVYGAYAPWFDGSDMKAALAEICEANTN